MNTVLAHILVAISILFVVGLLSTGVFVALHTISKASTRITRTEVKKETKKPIADIEDLDVSTMFKSKIYH